MITVNGWTLYTHPLFADQIERLTAAVEQSRKKDPDGYSSTANAKLLAASAKLMFEVIPVDLARPEFRQGGTLGPSRKHWFRAKFGNGRFRLFFRYSSSAKIIIYAWVNDSNSLRTYGSKSDAYAVFKAMLDTEHRVMPGAWLRRAGNPPEEWDALIKASTALESE